LRKHIRARLRQDRVIRNSCDSRPLVQLKPGLVCSAKPAGCRRDQSAVVRLHYRRGQVHAPRHWEFRNNRQWPPAADRRNTGSIKALGRANSSAIVEGQEDGSIQHPAGSEYVNERARSPVVAQDLVRPIATNVKVTVWTERFADWLVQPTAPLG